MVWSTAFCVEMGRSDCLQVATSKSETAGYGKAKMDGNAEMS